MATNSPTSQAPFFVDREVIVLKANGEWIADGCEISHDLTRRLFARSLKKNDEGYYLHIGRETKQIQVEDTAYFVIRIDQDVQGQVELWMNDETREILNPQTLSYRPGRLTCKIKNCKEEAKFLRAPYMDLLKSLKEDEDGYYLEFGTDSRGTKVRLGKSSV